MTVGIVGLGLIGGSMAKAYKNCEGYTVLATDIDRIILEYAALQGATDGELTDENISKCDLILIALYPQAAIDYLREKAQLFSSDAVIIDLCGIKSSVCKVGFELADEYGFTFVGGHPMAGKHFSGFKYSSGDLFKGAPMVLVPKTRDDIFLLDRIKCMLAPADFGRISVTTAEKHDEIIAFTSQLAHVVSNAYVKSPTALAHTGFSAGSYKDLTRVAWLNEHMWSELFVENKEYLENELETIISSLGEYLDALRAGDKERLKELLRDGRELKEKIDG